MQLGRTLSWAIQFQQDDSWTRVSTDRHLIGTVEMLTRAGNATILAMFEEIWTTLGTGIDLYVSSTKDYTTTASWVTYAFPGHSFMVRHTRKNVLTRHFEVRKKKQMFLKQSSIHLQMRSIYLTGIRKETDVREKSGTSPMLTLREKKKADGVYISDHYGLQGNRAYEDEMVKP